ncbi:MAG: hypothetical protein A2Y76_13335 [Planctomycetes bacterium RBG_13_60_9]|nr:MAG: hypothetical protein A2Y76_13335 [Planctomycetes bacterium RBG_13_60_9]
MISRFDEWLLGESRNCARQYVVHTLPPRFVAEILYSPDLPGGYELGEFDWIDDQPSSEPMLARLIQETRDAIWDHHLHADYDVYSDEEAPPGCADKDI